jgi:hypothetical protein
MCVYTRLLSSRLTQATGSSGAFVAMRKTAESEHQKIPVDSWRASLSSRAIYSKHWEIPFSLFYESHSPRVYKRSTA